jgi:SpoVK/Ycf46/Vps4 family AAA+-type ATPase
MKVLIISFSDIHIKTNGNPVLERIDKIFDAVKNIQIKPLKILILISGDISYSGKSDEFIYAFYFLEEFRKKLVEYCGCDVLILPAPGNHDCEFREDEKNLRRISIEDVYKNEDQNLDSHMISFLCSPLKNFIDFRNNLTSIKYIKNDNQIFYQYDIQINSETNLKINCFSTSWLSQIKEQQGKLYFPLSYLPQDTNLNVSNLTISILHHPYNWYTETNARQVREYLDKNSDIIITGHEHIKDQYIKLGQDGNFTNYIESDLLQGDGHSGFNIILVDLEKEQEKVLNLTWETDLYKTKVLCDWISYKQYRNIQKKRYKLNEQFRVFLTDIGLNLTHPRVNKPSLDDLYVFPTILDLNFEATDITIKSYLSTENMFNFKNKEKVFLVGADGSGKTAFCKTLYKKLYNTNYFVPIFLEGKSITSTSIDESVKEIEKAFCKQYDSSRLDDFQQFDRTKIIILIDDFHSIKLNNKYKSVFLSNLIDGFPNVFATVNNYFLIEELLSKKENYSAAYDQFSKYQITEFGHVLRNKLVYQWIMLGRTENIEDINEFARKVYESERKINTIVGKSFIPAYPFFLLTILQTIEAGTPLGTHSSQYGYYYQYLISQALIKTIENSEIDFYDNYITEYAYFLFESDLRELSRSEILKFHNFYCGKYQIEKNLDRILDNLVSAELFYYNNENYWIRYNYIFYYYVAKYFANNLSNEKVKETVKAMSVRIYREEFANIILFLTHLSKDPFILNLLIDNASSIFSETTPIKFEKDTEVINNLIDSIPKEIIENKTQEEAHSEVLQIQDELDKLENNGNEDVKNHISLLQQSLTEDTRVIDIVAQLNYAFKTIEILGQIAKKYYASIPGDSKYNLTFETYKIGLRAINVFLSEMEKDPDAIVKELQKSIENKKFSNEQIEKLSRNLIVGMSLLISYGFIEKVAYSIGSEELSQTYDKILLENPTNAIRLIDCAIKLDYFRINPINDIRQKLPFINKNRLAFILLRQFVIRYLYMFKISIEQKEQFGELLDISVKQQRSIEGKSKIIRK